MSKLATPKAKLPAVRIKLCDIPAEHGEVAKTILVNFLRGRRIVSRITVKPRDTGWMIATAQIDLRVPPRAAQIIALQNLVSDMICYIARRES